MSLEEMKLPLKILPKYLSPGSSNAEYPNCMGMTYYHGQQIIAYGSAHLVVIASTSLNVISALDGHRSDSIVTSVAWAPYSGRLSSASNKKDIIIWEPCDGGWISIQTISLSSIAYCMSWSTCDQKFCVASDTFLIYQRKNLKGLDPEYETNHKLSFCSFSRDSRFILTLTTTNQEVFIWYKRAEEKNQYRRIPLFHPSKVKNMRWRTSDQLHERCSFMTLAEDQVVRIWTETGVNETLAFNVVVTIPSCNNTISAAFVTTSSRMIKNNTNNEQDSKHISVDNYAFGHGHKPITNANFREANIASAHELQRNVSWLLTCDSNNTLFLWELSGISASVRRTPKIEIIKKIPCDKKISPGEANKMFAVCRLENAFSNEKDETHIDRPVSLSLILQNQKTNMIENVDVTLATSNGEPTVQVVGRSQGHKEQTKRRAIGNPIFQVNKEQIKTIRIHQKRPLMVSIDTAGVPLVWKYDDTDVYDPTVLTKFGCQLEPNIMIADWNGKESQLLGFTGNSFVLYDLPSDPSPSSYTCQRTDPGIHIVDEFQRIKETPLDFRYCTTTEAGSLFILLTVSSLYLFSLNTSPFNIRKIFSLNKKFVFGAQAYISTIFPLPGATIYFYATDNGEVYTVILDRTDVFEVHEEKVFEVKGEEIIAVDYAHPGFLFIVTDKNIYITWRRSSQSIEFEEIQKIEIDYKPINVACIATGLFAVVSSEGIHMYHPRRESHVFPETHSKWVCTATCQMKNITAIEWSLDGILIVAQGTKISAFTKFMDSFFLEISHIKSPTIHHTLAKLARAPSDFNPMNIFPIAASGRIHLLFDMFKFLLKNYGSEDNLGMYTERLLSIPKENPDETIPIEDINEVTKPLIKKLKTDPIKDITIKQSHQLIHLLQHFNELQDTKIKALEPRAQVVARAAILEETAPIPFDIIILGWQVLNQKSLLDSMKFETWNDIEKSGIIYWCRDIDDLFTVLTPYAVSCFDETRFMSIFLLTLGRKNKILQRLFSKVGDDTRAAFFVRDFSRPKDKKFAEKNAYSALSKHDYHISAAMFFLSGQIESVVRVLLKNLGSYSLAFLACRCLDNGYGKNTKQAINEVFLDQARTNNDFAAVEFFNRILDPNDPIELAPRMTQSVPGFFFPESALYGDMRFNVCETANTTISMKSDYLKSAFYMGTQILSVLYLPYFADTILPEMKTSELPIHHTGASNKMNVSKSFANISKQQSTKSVEDIASNQMSRIKSTFTLSSQQKEEPETIKEKESDSETKKTEEEDEESFNNVFGGSAFGATVIDYSDYSDSESSSSSDDEQSESNDSENEEEAKNTPDISKTVSRDLLESTRVDNWFNEIILFNICRYRLEYFLETQYRELQLNSPDIFMIIPEIESVGPQTSSMKDQLHDYLFRSCKRRCFIYRRMLLMSTEEEKQNYILELCRNISLIPDQMLSFHISAQQITQLAATARIIIRIVDKKVVQFEKHEFIIAAIFTALFIYAFYYQDSAMMILLLKQNLSKLEEFPKELEQMIDVKNCKPCDVKYDSNNIETKGSFFSYILEQSRVRIYVKNEDYDDQESLKMFTVALIDFMLFQTFVENIETIQIDSEEFNRMHQFLNKLTDIYLQLFQYAILVSPQITKISSLQNIEFIDNQKLNDLFKFLLNKNQRETKIPDFCKRLYNKFSDAAPKRHKAPFIKPKVSPKVKLAKIKGEVNGVAVSKYGSTIFALTSHSVLAYSPQNRADDKDDENSHNIKNITSINTQKTLIKIGTEEPISQAIFKGTEEEKFEKIKEPSVIISHPHENFAIIGDKIGYIWGVSYDDFSKKFLFGSPMNIQCTGLAISYDGGMLAAAHGHTVSLYSFYLKDTSKPVSQYDVWGERITCLDFVKGSGLFACGQIPSDDCKSCVTFWDSLLPNKCAMIASTKFGKGVYPTSMEFSMLYNTVIVGCSNGSISMVDTRMFDVVATLKPHTKAVSTIKINRNESCFLSGSLDGSVMLWNTKDNSQLSVLDQSKSSGCVCLDADENCIYTLFGDGSLNATNIKL